MFVRLYARAQAAWAGARARFESEEGVVATEYLILLVLVALFIVAGAGLLGIAINNKLSSASNSVTTGF
jgi:Flp pilus assembly pilin Flp